MSETHKDPKSAPALPAAKVKSKRRLFPVVWVVPFVAAVIAIYVAYDRSREFGPKITISFNDSTGVVSGQTPIYYRGVPIGEVTGMELSKDLKHASVKARLRRSAAALAREGTQFWIVRPEIGIGNITGLQTVLSGPEIQTLPGSGEPRFEFVGLENPPPEQGEKGLKIVLRASKAGFLRKNTPVYYRGVEVGEVQDTGLNSNAASAEIHVFIAQKYAPLVRTSTVFWNVSGVDVSAGLFKGLDVKVESLRALMAGGIAFATPDDPQARRARDGAVFTLHPEAQKEWLEWAPQIALAPEK